MVSVILIVVRTLEIVPKNLEKRLDEQIRGRIETIQTTAQLKSARILRSLEELKRLAVIQTQVKNYARTGVKYLQRVK